jgi:hypothetical protein
MAGRGDLAFASKHALPSADQSFGKVGGELITE